MPAAVAPCWSAEIGWKYRSSRVPCDAPLWFTTVQQPALYLSGHLASHDLTRSGALSLHREPADSLCMPSRARRQTKLEQKVEGCATRRVYLVAEPGHADIKRCHRDLSIRSGRRAEKIDRADNFLQQALQIAFPDFDRVVHCISREVTIG
jgi:hypothetical protein